MAQQEIDIGSAPNDGTGDTLRAAGAKINANFDELYGAGGSGGSIADNQYRRVGSTALWDAARARGASDPARFFMIGDSNVAGEGTGSSTRGLTGAASTSMARKIADLFGFQTDSVLGEQGITTGTAVALATYDPRFTLGTGWAPEPTDTNEIIGGRFITATGMAAGLLRYTPTDPCTDFYVWGARTAGISNNLGVLVDGGSVGTIDQTGATATIRSGPYSASLGSHYIELDNNSASAAYIHGFEVRNGTDTPLFFQGGMCSAFSADLADNATAYNSRGQLVAMAPDFTVIYCTINDANSATALNTYYANIEAVIAAIASTSNGCLCVGFPFNGTNNLLATHDNMARALRNMAEDYDWFFYDCRQDFGRSYTRATALGYVFDTFHPNATGATAGAAGLHGFLSEYLEGS